MAEAHQAVAFQFTVTGEGIDVSLNHEALKAVYDSSKRSWKKRLSRFRNHLVTTTYPASPASWLAVVSVVLAVSLARIDPSMGLIATVREYLPLGSYLDTGTSSYMSTIVFATILWLVGIYSMRYMLKFVLSYRRFMYEPRGKSSLLTKIWVICLKVFCTRKPQLYSYQATLPNLPLPSIDDTLRRYLRSVRPFMDDEKYNKMERLATDFKQNLGMRLQRYLYLKWWSSSNYVSDWWEEYVYLRGRSALMVNSNYYGLDTIMWQSSRFQAARAANVTLSCLKFRKEIFQETLDPIMVQNLVPLCSWQYERLFNTTRIPGLETDKVVTFHTSRHVAVYHMGRFYKLLFQINGYNLNACELEQQFQYILDDDTEPGEGDKYIPALTAGERIPWAAARQKFFKSGDNKVSLDIIEKAAFVVVLDEDEHDYDPDDYTQLDRFGRSLLHGKGYDRWFDKSFNLVVFKNGRVGCNAEHSIADAPIMAHLFEYAYAEDYMTLGYREDGHCRGTITKELSPPQLLKWNIVPELLGVINTSREFAINLANDVDLHVKVHNAFGKGLMKKCKVSPDAFIQMAMQLAYYRDQGRFNQTYEASMTRLFREGRTETVRPCTIESCDFVRSMDNPEYSAQQRLELFKKAVDVHVKSYRDAMNGKGIDRHLFCLYVVSKYLEEESPFLHEALTEPWRLSTSQTPHQQTKKMDLVKHPEYISAGGGFGPVSDDGYGVSYIIAGENMLFIHISCKVSCSTSNSRKFGQAIEKALADVKNLFKID
ncbi:carnitine O-palmitoyltransferase 1, liver isoform-like isoform X2 [Antedon mediterranea]|uniref:carnitine O-palmitoyltransferase 1, liver isoform-like isoform X2 n=1 Tax=Antedon mediterranea TaxID=105859 RepID=UPI003AF9F4B7